MQDYQAEFIQFALDAGVLRFGEFKLKSGRLSPYFFNAGLFDTGSSLAQLGRFYAAAIEDAGVEFDILFGPAYKGIPLASSAAIALSNDYSRDVPFVFNRKEVKDHGEGGQLVGATMAGQVLVIDDVISAGTAIRESQEIIRAHGASFAGVVVALDRQERGTGELSAIQEVEKKTGKPVISIVNLAQLVQFLNSESQYSELCEQIARYQAEYGISAA